MKKAIFFVVFLFSFIIVGLNLVKSEGITETFDVSFFASYDSENLAIALELQGEKAYGSKVGLNANISGYDFVFWIVNGVVRYDLAVDHEFIVTGNLDIVAVFDNEDENPVVFMDSNGKLINIQYVENGLDADPPATGSYVKPGYVAAGWSESHLEVTAPTVLVLQYEIDTTSEFLVTVNQGTGSANYLFNTIVTVSPEININPFSHWEVNGEIVSYQEEYSFTVFGSTEITAIFKESPDTVKPLITLSDALELHSGKKSFVGQFEFPEGYTLIDYGMITSLIAGSIELGDEGVVKHTGFKYVAGTNEFLMTYESEFRYFRAYLVLENLDYELEYFYSRDIFFPDDMLYLDFEGVTKASYDEGPLVIANHRWILSNSLIGSSASDAKVGSRSIRVQSAGYIKSDFVFPQGVESIFFLHAKYGNDANAELRVQYAYQNDPNNWITINDGENDLVIAVDSIGLKQAHVPINIAEPIFIRIIKSGGNRVNIDSLIINDSLYVDDEEPIISAPPTITSQFGELLNPFNNVVALDNFDGDISGNITYLVKNVNNETINAGDFSGLAVGEYTIHYSVLDSSSNSVSIISLLTIIGYEWDYLETFTNFTQGGSYGDGTFSGVNNITWEYKDALGTGAVQLRNNASTYLRATIPNGISTFSVDYKNGASNPAGVILYINGDLIATSDMVSNGVYTTFIVTDIDIDGIFTLEIKTTGNQLLLDNLSWISYGDFTGHPPVISGTMNAVLFEGNDSYDPLDGVTASDLEDGDLSSSINYIVRNAALENITSGIDFSSLTLGLYTIEYLVEDSNGNISTSIITLEIKEYTSTPEEQIIYSTGFESLEGFTHGTTYNNTTIKYDGPTGQQWGTYYGTASTTSPLSGLMSNQMRWYTTAVNNLGYTHTNFNLSDVIKVEFSAASTLGLKVEVSISVNDGVSWIAGEVFNLTGSSEEYTYYVPEPYQSGNIRVRFKIYLPTPIPTGTARLYIDNVSIYGMR